MKTTAVTHGLAEAAKDHLSELLASSVIAADLHDDELRALGTLVSPISFSAGQVILEEGASSRSLYFVCAGTVAIEKRDAKDGLMHRISELQSGEVFGELSFLDGAPASATVRAQSGCLLAIISRDLLSELGPDSLVRAKLDAALAVALARRLRRTSEAQVAALRAELDESRMRVEFGRFFLISLMLFLLGGLAAKLITNHLSPTMHMTVVWAITAGALAPSVWFLRRSGAKLSELGLTTQGWQRAVLEGLGVAVLMGAATVGVRMSQLEPGQPLITLGSIGAYSTGELVFFLVSYGPHSFIQEFLGRCVVQTSLARLMPEAPKITPIVVTSVFFFIYHVHVGLDFAALTFVVSMIFGTVFARHRTVISVALIHYLVGLVSVAVGLN